MLDFWEQLRIRVLVRVLWRSRRRLESSLVRFEATEDDSAWQILRAAEQVSDPKLCAELFGQVMEEISHAEGFRKVYKQITGRTMRRQFAEKRYIFHDCGPEQIFAICTAGEGSALKRFSHIESSLSDGPLKDFLQRVISDEVGHVHQSERRTALAEIRKAQLRRAWQAWLRQGQRITRLFSNSLLTIFYFVVIGIFGPWISRRSL